MVEQAQWQTLILQALYGSAYIIYLSKLLTFHKCMWTSIYLKLRQNKWQKLMTEVYLFYPIDIHLYVTLHIPLIIVHKEIGLSIVIAINKLQEVYCSVNQLLDIFVRIINYTFNK